MSDNNNDLEDFGEGDDSGFDDFSAQGTLGDMWRNNPLVKVGVIFGVFALIVGGIIIFGGSTERGPRSRVPGGSEVREPPATGQVSEVYRKAIEDENVERVEQALRTNRSALPTPLEPPKGMVPLSDEEEPSEDPLERWRRLQEARKQQAVIPQQQEQTKPTVDTRGAAIDALSKLMVSQMKSVLDAQEPTRPRLEEITDISWLLDLEASAAENEAQRQAQLAAATGPGEEVGILIQQGSIVYAQLLLEANTDAPGPVLAQIVTGPYAGSRMLGSFKATENYLVLSFESIVIDGVGHDTEAIAIDPDSSLPGLATEIDRRYFKRVILPMASAFVEGLSSAIAESGQTTIVVSAAGSTTATENRDKDKDQEVASGIEEAGKKLSKILDEQAANTRPMIKVAAGTPIGILFIEPVEGSLN